MQNGVLVLGAKEKIRLLPALNIPDDLLAKGIEVLKEAGYICKTTPVIAVECEDKVGALDSILNTLYDSNININYVYLSFNRVTGNPIMVMHTDEARAVENILINKGYKCD